MRGGGRGGGGWIRGFVPCKSCVNEVVAEREEERRRERRRREREREREVY